MRFGFLRFPKFADRTNIRCEAVASRVNVLDITRGAAVVPQHLSERANVDPKVCLFDEDIRPRLSHQLFARKYFALGFYEGNQQIERTGTKPNGLSTLQQDAASWE
jgi:hypothetical protein